MMITETFVAPDPKGAYAQAIEKYGAEIELVSAKQIKEPDGTLLCEVSVSVPKERFMEAMMGEGNSVKSGEPVLNSKDTHEVTQALEAIESDKEEVKHERAMVLEKLVSESDINQYAFENSEVPQKDEEEEEDEEALLSELNELKNQLQDLREGLSDEDTMSVKQEVRELLFAKNLNLDWVDGVLDALKKSELELYDTKEKLIGHLQNRMKKQLIVKPEKMDKKKIVMLVGPTGVGKTTSIAKLAARYSYLMEKPYKVALVNLDTYKVGAIEQLEHYANIMQIEHATISSAQIFEDKLKEFDKYDVVLIDTAGMSPFDTQKFIKTIEYINVDIGREIDVNLVLSATVKYEDLVDIYNNFSFLNISSVLVSKFDETKHFGALLSFLLLKNLPLSYFSVGQDVPYDLMVADKNYLLAQFNGDLDES
jgi:flagellar biosynthesis protein FlhF